MPIYEYICEDCSEKFELLKLSSEEIAVCPKCGGKRLSREISTVSAASSSKSPSAEYGSCTPGESCDVGASCGCPYGSCKH